jgi:hypothetical protein
MSKFSVSENDYLITYTFLVRIIFTSVFIFILFYEICLKMTF